MNLFFSFYLFFRVYSESAHNSYWRLNNGFVKFKCLISLLKFDIDVVKILSSLIISIDSY